jgi:predicted metallo-beta-lactamase superfamily hydrolase
MPTHEHQSEITRLRQRLAEEYEAAQRGLSGLVSDSATHQFVTQHMDRTDTYHETLQRLVGEQEATHIVAGTLETL